MTLETLTVQPLKHNKILTNEVFTKIDKHSIFFLTKKNYFKVSLNLF